jgi:CBS domain-containing protein
MLGIVSERDIVACIAEKGAQALEATVAEIMTARVLTCREDDTISTIARRMTDNRVRHIPVVEGARLVGVVSVGDIVKNRIAEMELETGVLRDLAMAGL